MPTGRNKAKSTSYTSTDLNIESIRVSIEDKPVGTLAMTEDGISVFEYDAAWLEEGYSISPFSLPLEKRLFVANRHPLDGMFGVFADSLPDGWGRLLVDRFLVSQGIDPNEISLLARLAIVGSGGMGALEFIPSLPLPNDINLLTFDELSKECTRILKTDYSPDLDTLFAMGGSSGGVRPKILTEIDGEDWIVKFPSSFDPIDIGAQEFRYSQLARACGIDMSETRLMPSNQHEGYFAIKRFDREKLPDGSIKKLHMVSAAALLETSHRIPNLDYSQLFRLTLKLTNNLDDVEKLFRLMVFNVAIGNRDDHAKNFSFLYRNGQWQLSPAYDLTSNPGINGEHSTTVNGKGKNITTADMIEVGKAAGLNAKSAQQIVDGVLESCSEYDRGRG